MKIAIAIEFDKELFEKLVKEKLAIQIKAPGRKPTLSDREIFDIVCQALSFNYEEE